MATRLQNSMMNFYTHQLQNTARRMMRMMMHDGGENIHFQLTILCTI